MAIKKVGVLGCGLMGAGIAQVAAAAGYDTLVREVEAGYIDKGFGRMKGMLAKGVEKGKVQQADMDATMGRLKGTTKLEELADCDIIIEAIIENLDLKRETFQTLNKVCGAETLFASNTSSLSITEMGAMSGRPDRFLGLHFFNPVPLMKLVEVVRGLNTSDDTMEKGLSFAKSLGKAPIVAKDSPGFVVNLLLVPYLLGAIRAVEMGIATVPDIDQGMVLGCGYPMGPLTLLDFVGLDTTYYIANIMFDEFKGAEYAAPTLLKRMVLAGYHGRKSGKGFYDYSSDPPKPTTGLVMGA
ncbi:MAG TPA: 3-hydroxybutyryl-CoA dehydrogenase [Candidatus Eisenbacteria bacterium]